MSTININVLYIIEKIVSFTGSNNIFDILCLAKRLTVWVKLFYILNTISLQMMVSGINKVTKDNSLFKTMLGYTM